MLRARLPLHLAVAFLILIAAPARAAQDGVVVVSEADVHVRPDTSSEILGRETKGKILRISQNQQRGWYRVELSSRVDGRKTGWVQVEEVRPYNATADLRDAGMSAEQPARISSRQLYVAEVFYGMAYLRPSALQTAARDTGSSFFGTSFGAQFGYRLSFDWTALAHFELHSFSRAASAATFGAGGTLLALQIEKRIVHAPPFSAGFAFGAGESLGSSATIGSDAATSYAMPVGLGKFVFRYFIGEYAGAVAGLGYRYMTQKSVTFASAGSIAVDLSAPFFELGAQLRF